MDTLQRAQSVAQFIGTVALLVTLGIYVQLRTIAEQVAAMRRGANAQPILCLLSLIKSDEVRAAWTVVSTTLHRKQFSECTDSECTDSEFTNSELTNSFACVQQLLGLWSVAPGTYAARRGLHLRARFRYPMTDGNHVA